MVDTHAAALLNPIRMHMRIKTHIRGRHHPGRAAHLHQPVGRHPQQQRRRVIMAMVRRGMITISPATKNRDLFPVVQAEG